MTPYYDRDGITVYNADYQDILPQLTTASFDAIITDPPYGETSLSWDSWPQGWPSAVAPLLKTTGSMWCFGSMRMFLENVGDFKDWRFAEDIVWEKQNGSAFHNDRFRRVHETCLHYYLKTSAWDVVYKSVPMDSEPMSKRTRRLPPPHFDAKNWKPSTTDNGFRIMRSVLSVNNCQGYAVHPTQKPEGIIRPLIENACPKGGLILDLFGGSGTTALVARALGRQCVLIEADEQHCLSAVKRLAQTSLFNEDTQ